MYPISLLNPMIWVTSLNPNQSPFFWRLNPTKSPFFHHHQSPWKITFFLNFPSGFPSHKHHWATDKPCEASLRDSSGISSMPALAAFSASVAVATACSVSWRQLEAAAAGGASLQMVVKYGEKHKKKTWKTIQHDCFIIEHTGCNQKNDETSGGWWSLVAKKSVQCGVKHHV